MKGEEQPCPIGREFLLVPTKTIKTEMSSSCNLLSTSPLPLVLETLPFIKAPNSVENLFADPCLPMRTHRADLLESVLEKSVYLDDVFFVESFLPLRGEMTQKGSSESFGGGDRKSSSLSSS